jgi:hypothetical protein
VSREFNPICRDFGFCEVHRDQRTVRVESPNTHVTFVHSRFDEVEISFGRLDDGSTGERDFSLFDLLYCVDPQTANRHFLRSASTPDQIAAAVGEIISVLRTHGHDALAGDPSTYDSLADGRAERQWAYQDQIVAARVRPEAEKAFRDGDYQTAARLYRSIRSSLSEVEQRKLALAEKKGATGRDDS